MPPPTVTYQLRVVLKGTSPPIWRRAPFACRLPGSVYNVEYGHCLGGFVNEIVEDVPHDESPTDVLFLEIAHHRERMRMSFERSHAAHDLRKPIAGAAATGILRDVVGDLAKRSKRST